MLFRFTIAAALVFLTAAAAQAEVYDLPPEGDDLIGHVTTVTTEYQDTFVVLARRYSVGFNELRLANPDVDPWLPGKGTTVTLPKQYILPDAPRKGIVVNLAEMRLYYYPTKSDQYYGKVFTYPLGIGRKGWSTPLGTTHIVRKDARPAWYPPKSIRKEHAKRGDPLPKVVPPGPRNPLGLYALYLGWPAYLIHGTNKPAGIGLRVSHGCLRMYPEDIAALFSMVEVGTLVTVIDQPYKFGWHNGKLYMAAHPPDASGEGRVHTYTPWVKALIEATEQHPNVKINWDKAQATARKATGIPTVVATRPVASNAGAKARDKSQG